MRLPIGPSRNSRVLARAIAAAVAVLGAGVLIVAAREPHLGHAVAVATLAVVWSFLAWRALRALVSLEDATVARLQHEFDGSRRTSLATIQALAYAVEARDPLSVGHLARVEELSVATAERLGLDPDDIDAIRVAALLHEIGRLGVPDNILAKDGGLTEGERGRVQSYPVLGARILGSVPFPWPVAPLVLHHREQFNGSGYPDGLAGEDIPLGARIICAVDTYATLVTARPYRPSLTFDDALGTIRAASGETLDPMVVDALLAVIEEKRVLRAARVPEALASSSTVHQIASAQHEMQALYGLACEIGSSLNLPTVAATLAQRSLELVHAETAVIFVLDEAGEYLRAVAASGVNQTHYMDSLARYGTYLTGRAASRGEVVRTGFLSGDVLLATSTEEWEALRSTLIAPMQAGGCVIGTVNLYHRSPGVFSAEDARILQMVASLAGSAVHNARIFAHTQESAFTDPVTGLRNSRYLVTFLTQEINRTRKNQRELAVLGVDLDRFKEVNDTLGHARGDEVLVEIAEIFRSRVRNYDLVARTGGDEFTIVLPETTRDEAEIVAEKLRSAVARYVEQHIRRFSSFPSLGISAGIAMYPRDGQDIDALLAFADRMMYDEKQAHRRAA